MSWSNFGFKFLSEFDEVYLSIMIVIFKYHDSHDSHDSGCSMLFHVVPLLAPRQALKTWPVPKHSDLQLMLDAEPDSDHPMWLSEALHCSTGGDFNIFQPSIHVVYIGLYWFILVYDIALPGLPT